MAMRRSQGGSDTGMGFSYLRMIHIASTAWTGLSLLYQTNEVRTRFLLFVEARRSADQ